MNGFANSTDSTASIMLFSIALAPGVLRPPEGHTESQLRALSVLLRAILQNGTIVATNPSFLRAHLTAVARKATGAGAKALEARVIEFTKEFGKFFVSPSGDPLEIAREEESCDTCVAAAQAGLCDAIVVLDDAERCRCEAAGAHANTLVMLEEFAESEIDERRSRWLETQRLWDIPLESSLALVGAALRYATEFTVADKMIGRAMTNNGDDTPTGRAKRVRKHLAGVKFLFDAWHRSSPLAGKVKLTVRIITVAGHQGPHNREIDPIKLRDAIDRAALDLGLTNQVCTLEVTLKRDTSFNDRLLHSRRRTWGIQHSLSDFGSLLTPGPPSKAMIDSASEARSVVFREISEARTI